MIDEPLDVLARELGTPPPPAFATLDPAQAQALAAALKAAREHQQDALAQAAESGVGFIPRLLRGAVKKVLFG